MITPVFFCASAWCTPFALSCPAFHHCLLKHVLGVVTVGHFSWLPTQQQDEDGPYPTCSFTWLLCFGRVAQQRKQLPKVILESKIFVSKCIWRSSSHASYFREICALRYFKISLTEKCHVVWAGAVTLSSGRVQECWYLFSSCGTFLVLHTLQWVSCWLFGFCSVMSPCFKRCKEQSRCFHAWFVVSSTPKSPESASWVIFLLPELRKRFASGDSRESWGFSHALLNSLQSKCQFEVKELEI